MNEEDHVWKLGTMVPNTSCAKKANPAMSRDSPIANAHSSSAVLASVIHSRLRLKRGGEGG